MQVTDVIDGEDEEEAHLVCNWKVMVDYKVCVKEIRFVFNFVLWTLQTKMIMKVPRNDGKVRFFSL